MIVPADREKYEKTRLTCDEFPANCLKRVNPDRFYLNGGTVVNASNLKGIQ